MVDKCPIVVDAHAIRELYSQEYRVFNLVADVGGSDVVVKAFRVVADHNLRLALTLVLALYELFLHIVVVKGLHE